MSAESSRRGMAKAASQRFVWGIINVGEWHTQPLTAELVSVLSMFAGVSFPHKLKRKPNKY